MSENAVMTSEKKLTKQDLVRTFILWETMTEC